MPDLLESRNSIQATVYFHRRGLLRSIHTTYVIRIRRGQSLVKRNGAILTCLTIRARIEVASSLNDSFLNAMRRSIARRGNLEEIRSDNGRNFVSREKKLRDCIKSWNHSKLHHVLLLKNIRWMFNHQIDVQSTRYPAARRRLRILYRDGEKGYESCSS